MTCGRKKLRPNWINTLLSNYFQGYARKLNGSQKPFVHHFFAIRFMDLAQPLENLREGFL
jgi:hypothetical protein